MKRYMIFVAFMLLFSLDSWTQNTSILPVKGTWINLVYQDVRNKYTNPVHIDNTNPELWRQKVKELSEMGIEYLVFMAVANEGKAFYPSRLMPLAYNEENESPVDAIMDEAADLGMKVFLSTGWAKNQDDNLRDPAIKQRQKDIMKELAALYKDNAAFYGWYLPVEDCLCPILSENAVTAVNDLSTCATSLVPGKKIMISPYGMVDSDFDNPAYARQLAKLKVDIIAYQDEVGCVREPFPLSRLRLNWKKLRAIHDRLDIALWANCETFTWEEATNDRASALIPAAYPRYLAQQVAASAAGVENIISFVVCGLIDKPASSYPLGQPIFSNKAYMDYMSWKKGDDYWNLLALSFKGELHSNIKAQTDDLVLSKLMDEEQAEENSQDPRWIQFEPGKHEIVFKLEDKTKIKYLMARFLNYASSNIKLPKIIVLSLSTDGVSYKQFSREEIVNYSNDKHDAWIEGILFEGIGRCRYVKLEFEAPWRVYMDEIFLN